MEIKELIRECHKNSREKGFWDFDDPLLSRHVRDSYTKEVRSLIVSRKLMLIVSELGEALEADRIGKYNLDYPEDALLRDTIAARKDTFEDEMADTCIRIFDLCGWMGIDLEAQIKWKMEYNKGREKLHGKQY